MSEKVDIRPLNSVRLENFLVRYEEKPDEIVMREDVNADELNQILSGSGLYYNAKNQTLESPGAKPQPFVAEASYVDFIRNMDTGGGVDGAPDGFIDLREADTALRGAAITEEDKNSQDIDPQAFLESIKQLVEKRYSPIARNVANFHSEQLFQPILKYLRQYNYGIMVDQLRHASEILPVNGLTKSAVNIGGVFVSVPHNVFSSDENDWNLLIGDDKAAKHARASKAKREEAIDRFEKLYKEGIAKQEEWALKGDFTAAVGKLSPDDQKIIGNQLAGVKFYEILSTPDDAERAQKMFRFAQAERPGFWGFGYGYTGEDGESFSWSGNSERGNFLPWNWGDPGNNVNFWNYTGQVNNLYSSRGILSYLNSKVEIWRPFKGEVTPEMFEEDKKSEFKKGEDGQLMKLDRDAMEALQTQAANARNASTGGGGSFALEIQCHIPGLGIDCQTWGDEAKMGIPGRMMEAGVSGYLGYRGIQHVGNTTTVFRVGGAGAPFKTWWNGWRPLNILDKELRATPGEWWKNKNFFKPFQTEAMEEAATGLAKKEAEAIKNGTKLVKPPWRGGRAWNWIKDKAYDSTLGKLPNLSEARKAQIAATASKAPGKGTIFLTNAMLVTGIVGLSDKYMKGYANPYDLKYELDLSKKEDPTKPDPILSAQPKKAE